MSLLDQLSSLCSNANQNNHQYRSSFMDCLQSQSQQFKVRSSSVTPAKTIKLFDDRELDINFKSNKKSDSNIKIDPLLNFIDKNDIKQNQRDKLTKLTKMSFLLKNKLRKVNYEFFVKLERYSKYVEKQKLQEQNKKINQKYQNNIKGLTKLTQTINILKLKYFQISQIKIKNTKNQQHQLKEAFDKLIFHFRLSLRLQIVYKVMLRGQLKKGWIKIQNFNKLKIKLDIFEDILTNLVYKKSKKFYNEFNQKIKLTNLIIRQNEMREIPQDQDQYQYQQYISKPQYQKINQQYTAQYKQMYIPFIAMRMNYPLQLRYIRTQQNEYGLIQEQFKQYQSISLQQKYTQKKVKQNIPLQLNSIKSHQEQINLNDCIDNGHLLMNQITRNKTLMNLRRQTQLQNLTISKIGSNPYNNNSSLNSSAFTTDGFILPQFNYDEVDKYNQQQDDTKPSTMRKSINPDTMMKNIKKPRSSLVVTKRKQSYSGIFTASQKNSLHNSNNKSKHNSNNKKLVLNKDKDKDKEQQIKDKQFLKKMLQQLNKKYLQNANSTQKKTLELDRSSNKKSSGNKKHFTEISANKVSKNKSKSQFFSNPSMKQTRQDNQKKQNITKDNKKNVNVKTSGKIAQNCFMSITLNQSNNKNLSLNPSSLCNPKRQQVLKSTMNEIKMHLQGDSNKLSNEKNNQNRIKFDLPNKSAEKYNKKLSDIHDFCQNGHTNQHQHNFNNFFYQNNSQLYFDSLQRPKPEIDENEQQFILQSYVTNLSDMKSQRHSICHESVQDSYQTGSRLSMATNKNVRDSLDKKRKSFQKSFEEWDQMFEKQKNKFLKRQSRQTSGKMSALNSSVINEIRAKIERCVLNDKNINTMNIQQPKSGMSSRKNSGIIVLKHNLCKQRQKGQLNK